MAGTPIVFDILARDRASSKFAALGKSVDSSTSHLSKFRSVATAAAKASLLVGVAAAGIAVKLGVDAVKAASDLSETLNKSRVIFGKHADGMEAWAGRADQSMGLSKQAALEAAASFGDMFGQIGFSGNQATAMSRSVVQLSADLGSFNNLDTADVAERMSAAFRGEYDSLQALIPNINAARVEQVALAKTGKTATAELTAQEKAAAVLAIVHKDGARAVGDFARTSDGLANRTKILKAELSNLQAEIGAKLLPIVTDVAGVFLDKGVPALEKFGDKAGPVIASIVDGAGELKDAIMPAVDEIVEAFGHLVEEGGGAGDMFEDKLVPAVRTAAEAIGAIVDFVDNLPGPVKDMGVEVGIAAVAFSYLAPAVTRAQVAMSGIVGTTATATTRMAALSKVAKTAAGVGGLLALAHGVGETNDALRGLELAGGGALLGFAAGGPIGAAIGFGVGALLSMKDVSAETESNFKVFGDTIDDYRVSLEAASGAVSQLTREQIAQNLIMSGAAVAGQVEGLSLRQLVDATLGHKDALGAVGQAYQSVSGQVFQWIDAQGVLQTRAVKSKADVDRLTAGVAHNAKEIIGVSDANQVLRNSLAGSSAAFRRSTREARQAARAAQDLRGKWGQIPDRVETKIKADGIPVTVHGMAKLAARYNLTPKQVKTLVRLSEADLSIKKIRALQDELDKTGKKEPTPKLSADDRRLRDAMTKATQSIGDLDRKKAEPKATLDLSAFYNQRSSLLTSLNTIPDEHVTILMDRKYTGGGPGNDRSGGDDTDGRFAVDPRLGINPRTSTSTFRSGNLFHGLGAGIIRAFAQGINGNANQAEHAVDKMMAAIKKALSDKKITEAAAKRMREAVQAMAREADQGRAMLAKRADFANTLRESFASELNLGELVSSETFGGIGDLTGAAQSLANRLKAFAGQLTELRQAGIPRSLIGEIASLGSDQGSKAAAAILSGSQGEQNALSSAYQQLQSAAGLAGNTAANAVHGSVRQIKNEFNINVHAGLGANGREIGRELEQALTKWAREQGRPLNFPAS